MAEWHRVAATDDVSEDDAKQIVIEGHPIGLYKVGGEFFAVDDICTHAFAILSEGYLEAHSLERVTPKIEHILIRYLYDHYSCGYKFFY